MVSHIIIVSSVFACTRLRPIALLAGLAIDQTRFNINIFQAYNNAPGSWPLKLDTTSKSSERQRQTRFQFPFEALNSLPWDLPEWSVHCMASLCSVHQKLWLLSCPSPNDPSSSSSNWSLASFANGTRFQHLSAQPKSAVMLLCKFLQNLEIIFCRYVAWD